MMEAFQTVYRGELRALTLFDLTVAFDTVYHDIQLQHLQQNFGVDGNAHQWFWSYLVGQTQYIRRSALQSFITCLLYSVLQGSCRQSRW